MPGTKSFLHLNMCAISFVKLSQLSQLNQFGKESFKRESSFEELKATGYILKPFGSDCQKRYPIQRN